MQRTRLLRALARGVSCALAGVTMAVAKIAARVTARKAKINAEKGRRGPGEFCATRTLVREIGMLVMAFHSAGYCADCRGGFGDSIGPGSFYGGAQQQSCAAVRQQR